MEKQTVHIYGDVEGSEQIIDNIMKIYDRNACNIFLGDVVSNYTDIVEFERSIILIGWLLYDNVEIKRHDLKQMKYLQNWNDKGLSKKNAELKKIKKLNFIIGNKEIRLYRALLTNRLKLDDEASAIIETYLSLCVPGIMYKSTLICHSYHFYTQKSIKSLHVKKIICGHSRAYGQYKLQCGIQVTVIDLTKYYDKRYQKEIIFEHVDTDKSEPNVRLKSSNGYCTGTCKFYPTEFPLVHTGNSLKKPKKNKKNKCPKESSQSTSPSILPTSSSST